MSGRLVSGREEVERLTIGSVDLPSFSSAFPAAHLQTALTWESVVLHPKTKHQIQEIENWVKDDFVPMGDRELGKRVKAGYRVLFHGPAGTGKASTATLLGKAAGRPVLRIDLARVLSKYIGETEKNLSRLFDAAREKDWILFFDEADALFGKRTAVRDSHDRYANQEVAYLLQAVETHPGLVIVATNQRNTIDDAFLRRFEASIEFLRPTRGEPIAEPPQRRGGHRSARGPGEPSSSAQRLWPDR